MWKHLVLGFGLGACFSVGAGALAYWISKTRATRSAIVPPCGMNPSECLCRAVSSTIECVEESQQLSTPLSVAGGIVCAAEATTGEIAILSMSSSLKDALGHAKYVSDLLPKSFQKAHGALIRDLLAQKGVPGSAVHPLMVRLITAGNRVQDATLKLLPLELPDHFLIVIVFTGKDAHADFEARQVLRARVCKGLRVCVCVRLRESECACLVG